MAGLLGCRGVIKIICKPAIESLGEMRSDNIKRASCKLPIRGIIA